MEAAFESFLLNSILKGIAESDAWLPEHIWLPEYKLLLSTQGALRI